MRKKLALTILVVIILLITVSVSYAYFSVMGTNTPQTINMSAGTLSLTFKDNDSGIHESLSFGDSIVKKFTIENDGTRETYATMDFKNMINTYLQGSLIYTLEYSTEENGTYVKAVENRDVPVSTEQVTRALAAGLEIPAGTKYYYKLTMTLVDSDTVDQTSDLEASFNTSFMIEEGHAPVKPKIINEQGEEIENGISLLNTIGTKVALGTENFYVIGNEDGKVRLLAEYNLDTVQTDDTQYYKAYQRKGQHGNFYSSYISINGVNTELDRRKATLNYLGKAVWDEENSICTYEGEELYLSLGYILDSPILWEADHNSCNNAYELVQNNERIIGTGLSLESYDYGMQSKCNIMVSTIYAMSEERYDVLYPDGFTSGEKVYENTNIKIFTDNYTDLILKRFGIYTTGDGLMIEDLNNLNCGEDSCNSSEYSYMFMNSEVWIAEAVNSNQMYTIDSTTIFNRSYNEYDVGIRPVLILNSSDFL